MMASNSAVLRLSGISAAGKLAGNKDASGKET
jgi:hypothetical protein